MIWAEENSRDALFAALRRKEVYGTSGPRHVVRFFGGFDYGADLCGSTDLAARGYAGGVPMGGDLPGAPAGAAPRFVLSALRDPGTEAQPGTRLQRLQIVKGWLGADGATHERVYDVAGDPGVKRRRRSRELRAARTRRRRAVHGLDRSGVRSRANARSGTRA